MTLDQSIAKGVYEIMFLSKINLNEQDQSNQNQFLCEKIYAKCYSSSVSSALSWTRQIIYFFRFIIFPTRIICRNTVPPLIVCLLNKRIRSNLWYLILSKQRWNRIHWSENIFSFWMLWNDTFIVYLANNLVFFL